MIRWEDRLFAHRNYIRGALGLLRCYLRLQEIAVATEKKAEDAKELEDSGV
ncbi:MAG: hypothetical protein P4M11_04865 [Candidatus Pacebacteria bacterium]|nr:hypothetical protein [Candidatus Paceibacterota bacterium]